MAPVVMGGRRLCRVGLGAVVAPVVMGAGLVTVGLVAMAVMELSASRARMGRFRVRMV